MPNYEQIKTDLRAVWLLPSLQKITPAIEVIMANESGTRPAGVYATLRLESSQSRGMDDRTGPDVDGVTSLVGTRVLPVSIQVFGANAHQLAENAKASMHLRSVVDGLRPKGIVVYDAGDVTNLTDLLDTEFEPRAQFDARFAVVSILTEDEGEIAEVRGRGVHRGADGEIVVQRQFTAPDPKG